MKMHAVVGAKNKTKQKTSQNIHTRQQCHQIYAKGVEGERWTKGVKGGPLTKDA